MYCLNPPLTEVPPGEWYCPHCMTGKRKATHMDQLPQPVHKQAKIDHTNSIHQQPQINNHNVVHMQHPQQMQQHYPPQMQHSPMVAKQQYQQFTPQYQMPPQHQFQLPPQPLYQQQQLRPQPQQQQYPQHHQIPALDPQPQLLQPTKANSPKMCPENWTTQLWFVYN